jgi:2,4-dienoyl-CoA reductase-like NADH-dependent reductase (Old Yellow Enzyme family)
LSCRATPPPRSAPDPTQPNPGTFHDVLAAYGHLVKAPGSRTRLILNGDLTPAAAGALIRAGRIDAASFGRSWISNPDFQRRVESGASLATEGDWPESWYVFEKDPRDGYTDYPTVT